MGITDFSVTLISRVLQDNPNIKTVVELGDQNLYTAGERYGWYANVLYEENGIEYTCIDINGGNGAIVWDMAYPQKVTKQYDLLSDFGFCEHVGIDGKFSWEAIWNCWKTKFELVKIGGIMINENPLTGNWMGHGFNYVTMLFYVELCSVSGLELIDVGEHPAMGNAVDGWNVWSILKKVSNDFPSIETFKKYCGIKTS